MHYLVIYSLERKGWCIFLGRTLSDIEFISGPYDTVGIAYLECKELNEIIR